MSSLSNSVLYVAFPGEERILELHGAMSMALKNWMDIARDELAKRGRQVSLRHAWVDGARIDPDEPLYAYNQPNDIIVLTEGEDAPKEEDVKRWLEQKRAAMSAPAAK